MEPNTGILTTTLGMYIRAVDGGSFELYGIAFSLIQALIVIELCIFFGRVMLSDQGIATWDFCWQVITISMLLWILGNFANLINEIVNFSVSVGLALSEQNMALEMRDPSRLLDIGFSIATPIVDYLINISLWDAFSLDVMLMGFSLIGIIIAYTIIAIQVFILYFYLKVACNIVMVLIPFGVLAQTSDILKTAIGGIVGIAVRFALLTATVSIGSNVISNFELPVDPTWKQSVSMCIASFALAFLAYAIPKNGADLAASSIGFSAGSLSSSVGASGSAMKTLSEQSKNVFDTAKSAASAASGGITSVSNSIKNTFGK